MTHLTKITLLRNPKQAPPIGEVLELPHNLNSTDDYFNVRGLRQLTENTIRESKEEVSLFDQVVARYQEELKQLASDENFKPLYIGIRQAGDEIHVWALVEDTDRHTIDAIDEIHFEIDSSLLLETDTMLLPFFFYPNYHGNYTPCDLAYQKLYPF